MDKVQNGNYVQVHYEGTLANGQMFDSSRGGQPLEIRVGDGQLIAGFEEALLGMKPEETKKFTLPPDKAYGEEGTRRLSVRSSGRKCRRGWIPRWVTRLRSIRPRDTRCR